MRDGRPARILQSLTNKNKRLMNVTIHFYDTSTDCVLDVPRQQGGVIHTFFEKVSEMVNYIAENKMHVIKIITHKANGEEVLA
jgi:hypothetical protein